MSIHKQRSLYAALAIAGITAATSVQAVNVSTDGRGQVLLYPYYTTRADGAGNTYGTLMSVVNATGSAKALRVRVLEGRNSRAVVQFNLFLSPFDVWTAAILPDANTGGAKIGTLDASCTVPSFANSPVPPFYGFTNFEYTGDDADGAGSGLDRTKEGFFEIIEMASFASTSTTGIAVTHVNAVPPCGSKLNDMQAAADAQPPTGGLFGALTLINVASGTDYTADAVALANFYQTGSNYRASSDQDLPDLTQAMPPVSSVQAPDGRLYESAWASGTADAVSAILMHDSVMNEYVLDSATKSGTDWVVTMPTKRYYVKNGTGNATPPFQRNFNGSVGSCDDLAAYTYDREERLSTGGCNFTLCPPTPPNAACGTANVVTFANSSVLGSTNAMNIPFIFQNGWLNLGFPTAITGFAPNAHKLINTGATSISGRGQPTTTGNTVTYIGLPVIGFAVVSYRNGTVVIGTQPVAVLSNYGGNYVHKFNTTIQ